jgi:AcrR family transcriptional regulator
VAAVELLDQQDYHSTTLDQIAERVGVSPAAVYRHFRNKQAVLDAAAEWAAGEVFDRIGDGRIDGAGTPTFEHLVDGLVDVLREVPQLISVLQRHLHALSPSVRDAVLDRSYPYVATWDEAVAVARPRLRPAERGALIHAVLTMLASATTAVAGPQAAGPLLRAPALAALRA